MPAELLSLREQLQNLHIVYEDALEKDRPRDEIEKLRQQILEIHEKIIKRQEMLGKQ